MGTTCETQCCGAENFNIDTSNQANIQGSDGNVSRAMQCLRVAFNAYVSNLKSLCFHLQRMLMNLMNVKIEDKQ